MPAPAASNPQRGPIVLSGATLTAHLLARRQDTPISDTTDADARWYEAARRADPVLLPNLRTGRFWPTVAVCGVLISALVLGYGLVFWAALTGRPASDLPETLIPLLGLAFQRSAALLGVIAFIVGVLVTHVRTHWQPIADVLTREQRRSIRRQMSGEDIVDYPRLPLIVMMAKQQHQYVRTLVPIYAAAMLFTLSFALLSDDVEVHYLSLGIALVLVAIGLWMLVTFRRMDAFIATHAHRVYERTDAWHLLVDELSDSELLERAAVDAPAHTDHPALSDGATDERTSK
jgi:hypothetical protein